MRSDARLFTLTLLLLAGASRPNLPQVQPNDNRTPAGVLKGTTLRIDLEVVLAQWQPEGETGPTVRAPAFREKGHAPQIPGPLIRVPAGTTIIATIRNTLTDSVLSVHGLLARPAATDDSLLLRPGQTRQVRFLAGAPGTYFYWAVAGKHNFDKDDEREQLAGALIVDPPGGSPPDRVVVINIWGKSIDSATYQNALTINGLSWPSNERYAATVGDTLRWRVINASWRRHPMHLHGFYFRVDSRGTPLGDTLYSPENRRLAVTEDMGEFETMQMTWVPERPGNWLFHCHLSFHVVPETRLVPPSAGSPDNHAHDPGVHMAGLVLGVVVQPKPGTSALQYRANRHERLFVQEGRARSRAPRALGYVLQRGTQPPAPDSVEVPGSLILLHQDEPTDITIINRLKESVAIHWHGIELESYSDGVAGWSGEGDRLAPSIMPGDSFTAHLTLPRPGTFIYHTHLNDIEQLTSGLYGPIVVLPPGQEFDPATDHVSIISWDGREDPPFVRLNGDSTPPPLTFQAGVPHRMRFINISPALRVRISLYQDSSLVKWRPLAKDGADLPPGKSVAGEASRIIAVGETHDFEFRPAPGHYRLVISRQGRTLVERAIVAR